MRGEGWGWGCRRDSTSLLRSDCSACWHTFFTKKGAAAGSRESYLLLERLPLFLEKRLARGSPLSAAPTHIDASVSNRSSS